MGTKIEERTVVTLSCLGGTDGYEHRYGITARDKQAYNGVASPLVLVMFLPPLLPSFCLLCCFISPASPPEQAEHLLMLPEFPPLIQGEHQLVGCPWAGTRVIGSETGSLSTMTVLFVSPDDEGSQHRGVLFERYCS